MPRRLPALLLLLLLASPSFASQRERAAIFGMPETAHVQAKAPSPHPNALGDAAGRWYIGLPPTYYPYVAAYDSMNDRLLLFQGGLYADDDPGWELTLGNDTPWTSVARAESVQPPRATRSAGVLDTKRNRLLVYGGDFGSWQLSVTYEVTFDTAPRWTALPLRHPIQRPPVRGGAYVAYDSKRDRLLVYGGSNYAGVLDDVWALTLGDSMDWQELHPLGQGPSPRSEGTMVYDPEGDRMILFGGYVQVGPREGEPTDQLFELDLSGEVPAWSQPYTTGDMPPPYVAHSAAWDAGSSSMLVVGGYNGSPGAYLFEPVSGAWTKLAPEGSPRGATRIPFTYDRRRDRYLVYGGGSLAPNERDVDVLSLRPTPAWTSLPALELPDGRFGAATILDTKRDRMLSFGGVSSRNFDSAYRNDVAVVDLAEPFLVSTLATDGTPPSLRHEPVGIYDPLRDRAVFFAGWTYPSNYDGDVWTLSFDGTPAWSEAHPEGDGPPGRRASAAAYDPLRDRMLVFGGIGLDDALGDLWALDLAGSMRWEKLVPKNEGPGPRFLMSVTYEPARDALLVLGGRLDSSSLGDLWRLHLEDLRWERVDIGVYGLPLERQVASYDASRDRLIVHGGWNIDYDLISLTDAAYEIPLHGRTVPHYLRSELSAGRYPDGVAGQCEVFDARRDRLVVFSGSRFAYENNQRSYLQFTTQERSHATPLAARSVAGGVHVVWDVVEQPGASYTVERMEEGGPWIARGATAPDENARAAFDDTELRAGWRYTYRLRIESPAGVEESGVLVVDVPGSTAIDFAGARPNPARGTELAIWFSLPTASGARIALHDLRGRVVWSQTVPATSAGPQAVRPDVRLPAGLYFAEVIAAGQSARRKITILP